MHDLDPAVDVHVEMVNDRPAEAILRAAEQYEALSIVVGATARGPMAGALLVGNFGDGGFDWDQLSPP